jgi:hypothetical protein
MDWIDAKLSPGEFDYDKKRCGEIAIALCDLVKPELDLIQKTALDVARKYWAGTGSEIERIEHLTLISRRAFQDHCSIQALSRARVLDRLVFVSLNTNGGLSIMAGEFLVELGEALNVSPAEIGKAFLERI